MLNTKEISLTRLFMAFARIGALSFGGALPWCRRVLVEEFAWLDEDQFAELQGLGQVLPGPNVVNFSILFGRQCAGWRGALLAPTGLFMTPVLLMSLLVVGYPLLAHQPKMVHALNGLSASAAGLFLALGLRLTEQLWPEVDRLLLCLAAFTAATLGHAAVWQILLILVPAGLLWHAWHKHRS